MILILLLNIWNIQIVVINPNVTEESMLLEIINDGENWYFEGVVYDPYTEKIDGVLVNRIAERMIYINQVDPDESDLDF